MASVLRTAHWLRPCETHLTRTAGGSARVDWSKPRCLQDGNSDDPGMDWGLAGARPSDEPLRRSLGPADGQLTTHSGNRRDLDRQPPGETPGFPGGSRCTSVSHAAQAHKHHEIGHEGHQQGQRPLASSGHVAKHAQNNGRNDEKCRGQQCLHSSSSLIAGRGKLKRSIARSAHSESAVPRGTPGPIPACSGRGWASTGRRSAPGCRSCPGIGGGVGWNPKSPAKWTGQ